jgi:hypothetical protein
LPLCQELAAIDAAAAQINPSIKIAIVTNSTEMIAVAQQYADSPLNAYVTTICPSLAAAKAWIGKL